MRLTTCAAAVAAVAMFSQFSPMARAATPVRDPSTVRLAGVTFGPGGQAIQRTHTTTYSFRSDGAMARIDTVVSGAHGTSHARMVQIPNGNTTTVLATLRRRHVAETPRRQTERLLLRASTCKPEISAEGPARVVARPGGLRLEEFRTEYAANEAGHAVRIERRSPEHGCMVMETDTLDENGRLVQSTKVVAFSRDVSNEAFVIDASIPVLNPNNWPDQLPATPRRQ